MPDIGNIGSSLGPTPGGVGPLGRSSVDATSRAASQPASIAGSTRVDRADRVELSEHARWLDALRALPPIRAEKVAEVRAALQAGTYETDEKLNLALERLLEDLDTSPNP